MAFHQKEADPGHTQESLWTASQTTCPQKRRAGQLLWGLGPVEDKYRQACEQSVVLSAAVRAGGCPPCVRPRAWPAFGLSRWAGPPPVSLRQPCGRSHPTPRSSLRAKAPWPSPNPAPATPALAASRVPARELVDQRGSGGSLRAQARPVASGFQQNPSPAGRAPDRGRRPLDGRFRRSATTSARTSGAPPLPVPYVGASERQVEHVLTLLRGRPGKMVDLGSGDGRIVLAAHRCGLRPAVGYELNPWLVGLARLHAWRAGCAGSVHYRREDLWQVSLRDCNNVSVFLAPSVLPLLEDKLRAELPAGARVVSGRFPLPTWQPVAVMGEGPDRVWAYDVHSGGPAGQASPGPSSASVPGAPNSQIG
ncbi:protein N-lysine methyltransferase FAM173A [Suricata suricatta]|uniref:protein N-lysine methyltransferase FAM173A n=1 Tax=Suricata suricatta TaxID=37032 RepID=UPI001155F35A|nr:protein N-lysine methyltransferase FAM173A [Suricata suricatta]